MIFSDFIELHRGYDLPKAKRNADGLVPVIAAGGYDGFHDAAKVQGPGVITGRSGTLGSVYFNTTDFWPLNTTLFVSNFKGNDPLFVYYYLKTMDLGRYATGTTVPTLNRNHLDQIKVNIPDLAQQREIANKLNLFDEKISMLNDINDNLLELGRSYYQNFVDTHDTEGQMVSTIAESVITGKTPSTKDESNYGDDVPFVTIPDMHSQIFTTKTTRSLSKKGADSQVKKYLPPFTLSVSSIGTPGLVTINPEESQTNQQINSVIAEKEKIWYLFLAFDSLKAHIENMGSGGSTILNLNKSNFEKIDIDWPIDKSALIEFNTVIEPIFMNILNNQREINSLSMVRDTLISELI